MYLRLDQIKGIPFKHVGTNVRISDKCSIYNPENISIGDNVRIDDFTILSAGEGGIVIGDRVHVGCYSSLIGELEIRIDSDAEISGRVGIYSSTNDFHCKFFYDSDGFRDNIITGNIHIGAGCVVGSGSVLMPCVVMSPFSRLGALSLLKKNIPSGEIWAGIPAKKIGNVL